MPFGPIMEAAATAYTIASKLDDLARVPGLQTVTLLTLNEELKKAVTRIDTAIFEQLELEARAEAARAGR